MERCTYGQPPPHITRAALSGRCGPALTFFHPDFTVGPGVSPDPGAERAGVSDQWRVTSKTIWTRQWRLVLFFPPLAGYTADRELDVRRCFEPQILTLPRRFYLQLQFTTLLWISQESPTLRADVCGLLSDRLSERPPVAKQNARVVAPCGSPTADAESP